MVAFNDLREFISYLRGFPGEVAVLHDPLNPRYEVAPVLSYRGAGGPVVEMDNVLGFPGWRIVGNVLGTRRRVALALGVSEDKLGTEYFQRKDIGLPPTEVEDGPVKETIITEGIDLTTTVPVLTHHEGDVGPYITAGLCIARDKKSGRYHMGIHRLQVKGPRRLGILLANPPLSTYFSTAEACGEPLNVAIAIGVDPALLLAAVTRASRGLDKLNIAGGLRGEPISLVKATTSDLMVPATAEVVIEGRMLPGIREAEGPFGESSGYYFGFDNPVIEVTAITHRNRPVYQAIVPAGAEGDIILGLCSASEICDYLSELVEGFCNFVFVPGTYCFHGILSIKKQNKAAARRAALLAMSLDPRIKQMIVVDDDVDINSHQDVSWAMATRFRADKDLIVLPGFPGYAIDPMTVDGSTSKVVMDATKPDNDVGRFTRIRPVMSARIKAEQVWAKWGEKGED